MVGYNIESNIARMGILEICERIMYDYHYNYVENKYDNKVKLLLTDTGILTYEIETENTYSNMWENKELFKFNKYLKDQKFCNKTITLVFGKIINETDYIPLTEFAGLKPWMYLFIKSECGSVIIKYGK